MSAVEIICSKCRIETLLQRESIYDGFAKVGVRLSCANCGHEYANESQVTFKSEDAFASVFTESDRSKKLDLFKSDETECLCRHCRFYLINPFTQFCGIHKKEVQSTDQCTQFQKQVSKDTNDLPF